MERKKRSHKIAAVDGGDKGRFIEWAKSFSVVPVIKVAAEFLHAVDGSERAPGESRELGSGQESKLACDLPRIEQQTDVRWRDTWRFDVPLFHHIVRDQKIVALDAKFAEVAPDVQRVHVQKLAVLGVDGALDARWTIEPYDQGI